VLPSRPLQPTRPRPTVQRAASGQTAVIPPPTARRERRWPAPRYLALIVVGVVILGLAGTVGVLALTGSDKKKSTPSSGSPSISLPKSKRAKGSHKKSFPPAINPSSVTVAVVNGTSVTGAAARTGTKVSAAGFRLGNLSTASQQQRAESVVMFKPGANRQARVVAGKLNVAQIAPIDQQTANVAGGAPVVVVVGADKAGG
jgi:hypothetical protein